MQGLTLNHLKDLDAPDYTKTPNTFYQSFKSTGPTNTNDQTRFDAKARIVAEFIDNLTQDDGIT